MTPKTLRIRIGTRLSALLIGCNIIPFIATIGTVRRMAAPVQNPFEAFDQLSTSLMVSSFVFIATGIWMTVLVTGNLTRPLRSIINVLREVRRGNFDIKVRVTSNDEIGYTGDVPSCHC